MRKLLPIPILIVLCSLKGFATANYSVQWQKGTSCYQQTKYDSAAFYFEQIAAAKPGNAEVYYNLGNTYYRLNRIGMAVLNYQRALKISPGYKDAKENLLLTEGRINNRIQPAGDIFFVDWWQGITQPNKASTWAIAAIITFSLIIGCMAVRRFAPSGEKLPVQLPGVLGFVCTCFLVLAFAAAQRAQESNSAVVMQNDAPLMNAEQKGKPLALVPEGTTIKITGEKGNWVEATLPDGRSGWLQLGQLTKI